MGKFFRFGRYLLLLFLFIALAFSFPCPGGAIETNVWSNYIALEEKALLENGSADSLLVGLADRKERKAGRDRIEKNKSKSGIPSTDYQIQKLPVTGDNLQANSISVTRAAYGGDMPGSGTALDPYQVWTADDLDNVRNDLSAHYIQMADIDLSGYDNWDPIGYVTINDYFWGMTNLFEGSYDGNNFIINNLKITSCSINNNQYYCADGAGLFGMTKNAVLKNIHIRNANITTNIDYNVYEVGVLAGLVQDTHVDNCSSTGVINSYGGGYIGGLIGWIEQDSYDRPFYITNSWSSVNINSLYNPTVNSYGKNISGIFCAGGFTGFTEGEYGIEGEVIIVESIDGFAEGEYGIEDNEENENCIRIINCYATGDISYIPSEEETEADNFIENAGGFVGESWGGRIEKSYSTGDIDACWAGGGFLGQGSHYVISNCYARGNVNFIYEYMYKEDYPAARQESWYGDFGGLLDTRKIC